MHRAAIVGVSGYVGGELARLLDAHPEFTIGSMTAATSANQPLELSHPNLTGIGPRSIVATNAALLAEHDVVFLALPHGASAPLVHELDALKAECTIIDLGADFRLASEHVWTTFYDTPYAGAWPYGLPELPLAGPTKKQRGVLAGKQRIAVPGCYPTAASLALAPGFTKGILEPRDISVVAASGVSGAGRAAKPHLMGAETIGSMSVYGVGGGHRHTPEIAQNIAASCYASHSCDISLSFTPMLAPMKRGILATASARLCSEVDEDDVRDIWRDTYRDEPFISVLSSGTWPSTANVHASNSVHMQVAVDRSVQRVIVSVAIDNLYKGSAGAAVQCANIAFGIEETTGLARIGVRP